jgi:hypothetical protein
MTNLSCLKCNGKQFHAKCLKILHEGKSVKSIAWFCDSCDTPIMDSEQMQDTLDQINAVKEIPTDECKKEIVPKEKRKWRPKKTHPWKKNVFKKSIDSHVISQ